MPGGVNGRRTTDGRRTHVDDYGSSGQNDQVNQKIRTITGHPDRRTDARTEAIALPQHVGDGVVNILFIL